MRLTQILMIIVRSPLRISLFGGGTDYPVYLKDNSSLLIGSAIDKYIVIAIHKNPLLASHRFKLVYSKTELCDHIDEIEHPAIRAVLNYFKPDCSLEITSIADLPARTGLGSSSAFSVGLIKGMAALQGKAVSPFEAAKIAHEIEIDVLQENVGMQDQIFAAFGGANRILISGRDEFEVEPLSTSSAHLKDIERSLLVFFLGDQRSADAVAKDQIERTRSGSNDERLSQMRAIAKEADRLLLSDHGKDFVGQLGQLLHRSWQLKRNLSASISNTVVDNVYETAMEHGAHGGKLLGAGKTGMMAFLAHEQNRDGIQQALGHLKHVPVKLNADGATIIHRG